jgi:hypothetical protein
VARQGIRTVLGQSETTSWEEISRLYRKYLFVQGRMQTNTKQPAFDLATAQTVVDQQDGQLSLPERLLRRIRHFTDGVILEVGPLWNLTSLGSSELGVRGSRLYKRLR